MPKYQRRTEDEAVNGPKARRPSRHRPSTVTWV